MGETDTFTERQLTVLIFLSLLSPLIEAMPYGPVFFAGRAAWLSPLAALPFGCLVLWIVRRLTEKAPQEMGLSDLAIRGLGCVGGRIFCVILALWLSFYAGSVTRRAAERLLSAVFPDGQAGILILVTLLAAGITAWGSAKGLARTAELLMPMLLFVIIVVTLAASLNIEPQNLLPVTFLDTGSILLGAIPVLEMMGIHVYFLFLRGYVRKSESHRRFPFLPVLSVIALAIVAVTLGTVSDKLALRLQNAFFVVIRNVRLFGVVDRVEAVVVAVWISTDFILLASLLTIVSEIWKAVFRAKRRSVFVIPSGVLALSSAFLIAPDAFSFLRWSDFIVPGVNLVMTTALIPAVLAVGRIRKP